MHFFPPISFQQSRYVQSSLGWHDFRIGSTETWFFHLFVARSCTKTARGCRFRGTSLISNLRCGIVGFVLFFGELLQCDVPFSFSRVCFFLLLVLSYKKGCCGSYSIGSAFLCFFFCCVCVGFFCSWLSEFYISFFLICFKLWWNVKVESLDLCFSYFEFFSFYFQHIFQRMCFFFSLVSL